MKLEARLKALEASIVPRYVRDDGRSAELFAKMCDKARIETERDQQAELNLTGDQHLESLYRAIEQSNKHAEKIEDDFSLFMARTITRALTLEVAELEKEPERAPDEREQETA
jgi:hypothetical protein